MHICLFERLLQFTHPGADHRTRAGAGRVNEICDPDFSAQLGGDEIFSILIQQYELGNRSVVSNVSLPVRIDLDLSLLKQVLMRKNWNCDERGFASWLVSGR